MTHPAVCLFSNLFPPVVSGSSLQSMALARELAKRGSAVTVVTAQVDPPLASREVLAGVEIYRLPSLRLPPMAITLNFPWLSWTLTPANRGRINQIMDRHRPDVIHLHNHMFDLAFGAARAARRAGLPLAVTLHTIVRHPRPLYNVPLTVLDRTLLRGCVIGRAEAILCPDRVMEDYAREAFGAAATDLVPYGLDPMDPPEADAVEGIRRRHRLGNRPVILSLGHVHDIRNRRDLLQSLPHVLRAVPETILLIAGAVGTPFTEALARRLGVREAVIFTGPVPHGEVPAYFALASVVGQWFEPSNPQCRTVGIAGLEAMGAGKAVVCTAREDVYGPGVLRQGENICLVEPGEPEGLGRVLIRLLQDEEERRRLGDAARRTIGEHFSWERVCRRTLAVYGEAIRRRAEGLPR